MRENLTTVLFFVLWFGMWGMILGAYLSFDERQLKFIARAFLFAGLLALFVLVVKN